MTYTKMRLSENTVPPSVKGANLIEYLGHRRSPRRAVPRIKPEGQVGISQADDGAEETGKITPFKWNRICKGPEARTVLGSVRPAQEGEWGVEPHRITNGARGRR